MSCDGRVGEQAAGSVSSTSGRHHLRGCTYLMFIQGLYMSAGALNVPVLPAWMEVHVDGRRPQHARVNTAPVVMVHIRLASLADLGSPARVAHAALQGYYLPPHTDDLVYIDAPYNIQSTEDARRYRANTEKQLGVLNRYGGYVQLYHVLNHFTSYARARVFIFIYTHSESTSGDLFYGDGVASMDLAQVCELQGLMHYTLTLQQTQWWNDVICPGLQTCGTKHEVTLAFMCCGSLIANTEKLKDLQMCAQGYVRVLMFHRRRMYSRMLLDG